MTHVFLLPGEEELVGCLDFGRERFSSISLQSESEMSSQYSHTSTENKINPYDKYLYCIHFVEPTTDTNHNDHTELEIIEGDEISIDYTVKSEMSYSKDIHIGDIADETDQSENDISE
ncbi:hypothetical protein SNEBB_005139 [Seison nebaliae]|nr:hypothetical protein SNEBB_005139 [Seison nebaliae]